MFHVKQLLLANSLLPLHARGEGWGEAVALWIRQQYLKHLSHDLATIHYKHLAGDK